MGITDPLPLRNCSCCENWVREYAMATADDKERVSAVCIIHRTRKYGSDTCSQWVKK